MTNHYTIETITIKTISQHLDQLAELLHVNVLDGASVSFILPFGTDDALAFWQNKIKPSLAQGKRILLIAKVGNDVAGCVMLDFDMPPNQPHRAEIAKLLVSPKYRRMGIARALMQAIEQHAKKQNHSLLVLDTANEGAESLYRQLGYERAGVIPNFALNTGGKQLEATTFMFKLI